MWAEHPCRGADPSVEETMITRFTTALLALAFTLATPMAGAQGGFPSRPIRFFVGFPPGGATDVLARALAQEARVPLKQEIIVVNKAGASGAIAVSEVATSKPDGYTIGLSPSSAFTLGFHFMKIRPDLLDITDHLLMAARQRVGMTVRGDSPYKTLKALIEYASKNPGKVSVGVPGLGTSVDVLTRAILNHAKVDAIVVPFKGDAGVNTALLGGQIVAGSYSAGGWSQYVQSGRMRLVASFQHDRFSVAPDVPTLEEMGYNLTGTTIQFVYGPKGLPPAVSKRLTDAFLKAIRAPRYVQIATKNELYEKNPLVGDDLTAYLLKDRATNAKLVERLGLKKQ
ncbi:MAG: hypothetical protein A3G25_03920 [Betaproteobacteria bacterium RIFCSPLOWO2_12_FULL_63_13]|nr:MAG: hypothetical protein A3G25_03920 [Betaproteobacteria bacterium RIFCSPLOWO2_12_FULL_63_13]